MKKPILIAAASFDEHAYGPVSKILEAQGYSVVVYKTDKLLSGEDKFTIDLRDGNPKISYNGISILPEHVGAAWYRKVASFSLPDADTQLAKQLYMNNEVRALHDSIWPQFYPEEIWLNPPARIAKGERKLGQLLVAREIGFNVPELVVSSEWAAITSALEPTEDTPIVVKMMRGVISEGSEIKTLPTTILDPRKIKELANYTSPFPGLYQPFIAKAREWRVTVVDEAVFPAAIYTDETAKDD